MKSYRPWTPQQSFLLPPSPQEWLPASHLVYFLLDVVQELDISSISRVVQAKDHRGNRSYAPEMLVALLLYGYCRGTASSRKLEKATYEDISFRVLCAGEHPDHTVISEFRRHHLAALQGLFLQVLKLCQRAGLVKLGHLALDGTKIQANASEHKAMSYERMLKKEQELDKEIKELLAQAEQADEQEDRLHGKDKRQEELPKEVQRREERLVVIRRAKAQLEAEAAQARAQQVAEQAAQARVKAQQAEEEDRAAAQQRADQAEQRAQQAQQKAQSQAEQRLRQAQQVQQEATTKERSESQVRAAQREVAAAQQKLDQMRQEPAAEAPSPQVPEHRVGADAQGNPKAKAQMNFTDPDSRIMKSGGSYKQAYNAQTVVSEGHQIIVACDLSNQAPDTQYLQPLMKQAVDNCEAKPDAATMDAGYWSQENGAWCQDQGIDAYISTRRKKPEQEDASAEPAAAQTCSALPAAATDSSSVEPSAAAAAREQMNKKTQTDPGRQVYARRKAVVEPVFGQIKEERGFRRFLLRGMQKVRAEWSLICATHNLLKLFRTMGRARLAVQAAAA